MALNGVMSQPIWQGTARVAGGLNLQVRRFDHELSFSSGTVQFVDHDLTLGCPKIGARPGCEKIVGLLDGASSRRARRRGEVSAAIWLPHHVDIHFERQREIHHNTPQHTTLTLSPRVRLLSLDGQHFELSGQVQLVEGRYTQKFEVKDFVFKPRSVETEEPWWQGDPRLETMRLSLHARSPPARSTSTPATPS